MSFTETRAAAVRFNGCAHILAQGVTTYHSMNYCPAQRPAKGAGGSAPWAHSIMAHQSSHVEYRDCITSNNYSEGMGMANCTDSLIVDCQSYNNNNGCIAFNGCSDSEITGCFVSFPESIKPSAGISVNGEWTHGGHSDMQSDSVNILVANNIVYGASPGIRFLHRSHLYGFKNISIYHNTIIHVRPPKLNPEKWPGGVSFKLAAPVNNEKEVHSGIGYENISIRNNLCVGTLTTDGSQMAWIGNLRKPEWLDAITFSHNWWSHRPDEPKARSSYDKTGGASVQETDLSPDRVPEDGQVKLTCSAIGAGMNLLTAARKVVDDYWKTARPSSPTMGAHEPTDE